MRITQEKLKEIIASHGKWLRCENGGERTDLRNADLRYASLGGANLRGADLSNSSLFDADLSNSSFDNANLSSSGNSEIKKGE